MDFPITHVSAKNWPALLREIPQPPQTLNYRGRLPSPELKLLAVVGSRRFTNYGKDTVEYLINGLRGYSVGIISGLALGIDSLAHEAALQAGLYTLAIPGSGIDDSVIYPARHRPLARRILEAGGGLLSEFEPTFKATRWSFPQRNRLVCGIADATIVIEAAPKSGSLITARMASDYNRDLLVVPGSIFSEASRGTHQFLKLGAIPVTEPRDILESLGIEVATEAERSAPKNVTPEESQILTLLAEPCERDELIRQLALPTHEAATLLMHLEIKGLVVEHAGVYRRN